MVLARTIPVQKEEDARLKPLLWQRAPNPVTMYIGREERWEGREDAGMREAKQTSFDWERPRAPEKPTKAKLFTWEPWPALRRFGARVPVGCKYPEGLQCGTGRGDGT